MAGSKGNAAIAEGNGKLVITGDNPWAYRGNHKNMYQVEHDVLFASIRNGKPINNGDYASKSSLMAIISFPGGAWERERFTCSVPRTFPWLCGR